MYLGTEVASRPATIKWADGRASFGVIPKIVWEEWGIDLGAPGSHEEVGESGLGPGTI